jgi:hypothetical protein
VPLAPGIRGRSGYGPGRLVLLALFILTTFSDLPLRLATLLGSLMAFVGGAYAVLLVFRRLGSDDVPAGYTSLMAGILVLSGALLIALGILGEYVGRINDKTTGKPRFLVRETLAR